MAGVSSPGPDVPAPRRKGKTKRKHTVGRVLLISSLLLALVTALGVVITYRHLNGNLTTIDGLDEIDDRPEDLYEGNGKPLNILVMGSDSRECDGCEID